MLDAQEALYFAKCEARKQQEQQLKKPQIAIPPSQIQCFTCHKYEVVYEPKQMKMKQDEGMDALCRCKACGAQFVIRT